MFQGLPRIDLWEAGPSRWNCWSKTRGINKLSSSLNSSFILMASFRSAYLTWNSVKPFWNVLKKLPAFCRRTIIHETWQPLGLFQDLKGGYHVNRDRCCVLRISATKSMIHDPFTNNIYMCHPLLKPRDVAIPVLLKIVPEATVTSMDVCMYSTTMHINLYTYINMCIQ